MPHTAWPKSTAARAPAAAGGHCWPVPPQETPKQFCLSLCGVSGSWCTQSLFEPSEHLWRVWGLILKAILPLLLSCWGFCFALGRGISPQSHSSAKQQMWGISSLEEISSLICVYMCIYIFANVCVHLQMDTKCIFNLQKLSYLIHCYSFHSLLCFFWKI